MTQLEVDSSDQPPNIEGADEQIAADRQEMFKLLQEVEKGAQETRKVVQNLIQDIKDGPKGEGISFLHLKNRLLASYNSNLAYVMLKKCHGKSLKDETAIERLVEDRTVLEKIRPIDQKLRYQVDKLVNIAESGTIDENDPLRFKPNPGGLLSKLEDSDDEDEDEDEKTNDATASKEDKKFKVPMNVPQYFNEEGDNEAAEGEKRKKKALSRSIMESIKDQYLDTPEEVSQRSDTMRAKYIQEEKERQRFEEDNFVRLPVTKEDRLRRRQMMTMGSMGDDITSFGKNFYEGGPEHGSGKKRKKSAGGSSSSKKKSAKKFKRRQ